MSEKIVPFPGPKKIEEKSPDKGARPERPNFLNKLTETMEFMSKLIDSDARALNHTNIAERRKALVNHSADDLRQEIIMGNELSWKEKPSWYIAVIEEIRARGLLGERK